MNTEQRNNSYRKPFQPSMESHWWAKLVYIIRESTAFFMLWLSIVIVYGVICAHTNEIGQDEFYRFIFFLQHPIVIVLNVLALLAALLHTVTWFNLVPKVVNVVIAGKKPPAILFIGCLWGMTLVVSGVLLMLVLGYFR